MTHEEQMIRNVLDGKTDSFRWIIGRYQHPVFQMIFNMIHDCHAAEDITQEVFWAVYQKLSTFDVHRCKFSTWLFTIARNKSINHLRKNKRTVEIIQGDLTTEADASRHACNEEFYRQIDQALNQLPFRQKRAFVLAKFENLPYDEIAQIECISIGTVRSRIHRAKQKLRKIIKQVSGDTE